MTITVGTDTYLNIIDADAYFVALNVTTWASASLTAKEAALREATTYIDSNYNFIGTQITDNLLAWPRNSATVHSGNFAGISYDSTTIPPQVEAATAQLALQALSGALDPILDRQTIKEKVDVIEVEYNPYAPSGKTYTQATAILSPLLDGNGMTVKLVRV